MQKEQRQIIEKFIVNVQAYRETIEKAKKATKEGKHGIARGLHNDAQQLGESVDKMVTGVKAIINATQQAIF